MHSEAKINHNKLANVRKAPVASAMNAELIGGVSDTNFSASSLQEGIGDRYDADCCRGGLRRFVR
jgi:hypothetical protein